MKTGIKQTEKVEQTENITRKHAIKKVGLTALAASSLFLLSTPASAASSGNNGHGNLAQRAPGNSGTNNNAQNSSNSGQGNSGRGQGGHKF